MAISFHQYSPRAQALICLVLSVLAFGAAWQVLLSPERAEVERRRTRLATVEGEVARAAQTARRLPQVQREVEALEAVLLRTTAILPDEKDAQDVLRGLHQLASESNLSISSFTPKPSANHQQYVEWPIEIGLEGGYHDLGVFFDRVATESRLISVSSLHLKTNATTAATRGQISATCVATTFVFAPSEPAAPAGAKVSGGQ
jgi:Tfp pilus assembly protein PilO